MTLFDQMLSRYQIETDADRINALHEVMHQVVLAGLYRGGFFDRAAFYGGTCLRMFYGLNRFSEDMDFSLLRPDTKFDLSAYFEPILNEFRALGREVVISRKEKLKPSNIESAFLKEDTTIYNMKFFTERSVKIKIEVDKNPPADFETEFKLLLLPFSFMSRCYATSDLFAGKMHAFLFRAWKRRVKGRDWYDFEWLVRNQVAFNLNHFNRRGLQSGHMEEALSVDEFKNLLRVKIEQTSIQQVKDDVGPFMVKRGEMDIWSTSYFLQLVDMITFR